VPAAVSMRPDPQRADCDRTCCAWRRKPTPRPAAGANFPPRDCDPPDTRRCPWSSALPQPPKADCDPPKADCDPPKADCDPPKADCDAPKANRDPPDCDPVPEAAT